MKNSRHAYGTATPKQRAFIQRLCEAIAPNDELRKTLDAHGAPTDLRGMTVSQASTLITALLKTQGRNQSNAPAFDPGELAADRWAESQVRL